MRSFHTCFKVLRIKNEANDKRYVPISGRLLCLLPMIILRFLLDKAGIDIILSDSLANVVLGLDSTTSIDMSEMIHHSKAVTRAVKNSIVLGDMPFSSYQLNPNEALPNAKRFITEASCSGVKLEWFDKCPEVTKEITQEGIPVMGHIGPHRRQKKKRF